MSLMIYRLATIHPLQTTT